MKVENKTIIITDPCYIIPDDRDSDWDRCEYGDHLERLGLNNFICRSTGYGDWSCTTYETDTDKILGNFCADAGLVAVFVLDEVLKYNPNFDYHIIKPWTTTTIPNFTGEVTFQVTSEEIMDIVSVIGKGNINFYTKQTGF